MGKYQGPDRRRTGIWNFIRRFFYDFKYSFYGAFVTPVILYLIIYTVGSLFGLEALLISYIIFVIVVIRFF